MSDADETGRPPSGSAADTGIFTVGPPLHAVRGGYVRRNADEALYHAVAAGRHAHVIAPARTGKSSLVAATSERLRNHGFKVAKLDLAQITERDGGTDAGRWYYSIAYRLTRQLRLKIDLQGWWQDKAILSNRQRLVEFYGEVILQNIRESIVVFLDEIQCVEDLPFTEHLLPSVRAAHNARGTEPDFQRLIFVLTGEGEPQSMFSDASLSPFNVSQAISLDDFSRTDIDVFATELNVAAGDARVALDRIYHWTAGQPYLTQKLAKAVARERLHADIDGHVDRIAEQQLAGRAALYSEPHMSHINRRVVRDRQDHEAMLNAYGRLRKGIAVGYEPEARPHRKLLAIGLVVVDDQGRLAIRNRVYEAVFTARWANRNLPLHWRGPALATAVIVLLAAVPFWYTQLLPKPYMRMLVSPTLPLEQVDRAWRSLRSFPGHVDTADRLYGNLLETRAALASDLAVITQLADRARALPESAGLPDRLVSSFWDRQARNAMREERRDEALIAALKALVVATPERRRVAAALIGDDYPYLAASLPARPSDRVLFNPRELLVTRANGARISQWSIAGEEPEARDPWAVSSLEVTPLLRRVVVDQSARVSRIALTVNVSHARLADLRMKLISPSGRSVELVVDGERASSNQVNRIDGERLAAFRGEPVNGTWTLSLRDEVTGVNGHLHGWNLSLNSQVVVENFDRGLDIPAPMERESDNVWFDDDGRYAVARALQSDNARLWDLVSAQPARSIAVPARESVIGLSDDARYLVTLAQDSVHLWNTETGSRDTVLDADAGGATVELSNGGRHLLVTHGGGEQTRFTLWALESGSVVARLAVAGAPAMTVIDDDGSRLAIADYDRAVRVWDLASGEQVAQIDLHALASDIRLSAGGSALAVIHGDQGLSLWRVDQPDEPVLVERGVDRWRMRFSPSGELFLAGSNRQGYQVYRSGDGALVGPPLHPGFADGEDTRLAFSADERLLMTASLAGRARLWHVPTASHAAAAGTASAARGHRVWRESGDSLAAIAPGGRRLAIADREGHVHTLAADASEQEIAAASDELSFLGHPGEIAAMTFSRDGALIASAGDDGTVRVWDAASGLPRPYHADTGALAVRQLRFSPSRQHLAVLGGQRVRVVRVDDGAVVADVDLGERQNAIAFGGDDRLYLAGESGTLRSLVEDRVGNWNHHGVWQGGAPLRALAASIERPLVVVVDAAHTAQLVDLQHGRLGATTLALPDVVREVRFTRSNTRVLLRTARWIHRAAVSSGGLVWLDALRTPKPLAGSGMVFDRVDASGANGAAPVIDPLGDRVLLLSRDAGFAELVELSFSHDKGPLLFGSREELLAAWQRKLAMPGDAP